MLCMIDHNDFVNAIKPALENDYFDANEEGMECSCLPDCTRISYSFELNAIYDEKPIDKDQVLVNFHYEKTTMLKYRTDVTFSGMDLLVGFGGIVSLFLGFSVMSGAEIIYYATIAMFYQHQRNRMTRRQLIQKIRSKLPFIH